MAAKQIVRRAALAGLLLVVSGTRGARAEEPAAPDFQQISGVLAKRCVGCHNPDDKQGGLILDSHAHLLAGGEHGPVVEPAHSGKSKLYLVLTGGAEPAMPPEGNEPPTADELALIKRWIDAGAKPSAADAAEPAPLVTPQVAPVARVRAAINAAAWRPDGQQIAVAGYRQVRLLDPASRATTARLDDLTGNITDLAYSADGKLLATAGGEPGLFGEARIIEVETARSARTLRGHRDSLYAVALSPDGKWLATAGYDQLILLWDLATGETLRRFEGHSGAVFDLAFSPDGRWLASASADRTVKLWDVATGKRMDTFGQALKELNAVAYRPDGQRVVAGGVDNRIRAWQISPTAQEGTNPLLESRFAHQGAIIALRFSPDGKLLASAAEDRTLRLWDAETLTERLLIEQQPDWAAALAFSPDGRQLFVGRLDGSVAFYDTARGEQVPPARPELAAVAPPGIERGRAVRLELAGKNLLGVERVEASDPRLVTRVLPAEEPSAERVAIEIQAASDLPRGAYELAVVTAGGTSDKRKLYVDDIAQAVESEPNGDPQSQAVLALPVSLWGAIGQAGDQDYFAFDAEAGQTIVLELAAKSQGSKLNGVLTLFDPAMRVVASNNDFDGDDDPLLAYRVPVAGRYLVRVSDFVQAGSAEHAYRLSIGPFAYVTGAYPLSVAANRATDVQLTGFNLPPGEQVRVEAPAEGEVVVPIDAAKFRSRKPVKLAVGQFAEQLEAEPNDAPGQATPLTVPGTMSGRTFADSNQADVDLFRFESAAGARWVIETDAARRGSPIDTRIEVLDAEGKPVPRLRLQAMRDSAITFRSINSQTVDLRVENWEEMELNQFLYMQGEVCKIFRLPQGPDSGFNFYASQGSRIGYFDTSATTHAVGEPCYIVEPRGLTEPLLTNGLPTFTVHYANDDDGMRRLGRDSRLLFTAPREGAYLVRVSDVRSAGSPRHAYRLTVRPARPDFRVSLGGVNPTIRAGSGRSLSLVAERIDDFDGEIQVEFTGLPPGVAISSPVTIQAGHLSANAVIYADEKTTSIPDELAGQVQVVARAMIDGAQVEHPVNPLGTIKLAAEGKVRVRLEPAEITIAPGTSVTATLKVVRNGFDGRINFSVENLPHGVIVDNIGLNGVLIPEGQTERQVFLTARSWVPETSRMFHAVAADGGGEASPPVTLHVRKAATVAQAGTAQAPPMGSAPASPAKE